MSKRLLILLFLLIWTALITYSQDIIKDNQLRDLVREFRQAEVTIPYPGSSAMDILTKNVSITSVRNKNVIINISPRTIDWFLTANYNYSILERADIKGIVSATSVNQAMDWQSYPTYTQYDSIMKYFASTYPSLCHLDTIGTSINGKYIYALKISDNPALNEDEPKVFYSSTMHGDETGGFVLMLHLIDYLLKNYNINTRVKNLVNNLEIWINPLANPDGTYGTGNSISSSSTRYNANGYDLNRNFPDPVTPYSITNVEQKETLDMVKFMRKHKFSISANFHAGDEVVNYPWDYYYNKKSKYHADNTWFYSISRAYADTVHVTGPSYMTELDNGITFGADWYSVTGGRQDFMTWNLQGREVTIELDFNKETPVSQLDLLWQYNWHSLMGYLENALYGIHGHVKDVHTSGPIPARVFISGHDVDSSHVYSDTLYGRFVRLLAPGSWNLTFSANGYRDTTINNVLVVAGQRTDLTVEMKSITTSIIDTVDPGIPLLYPNPASAFIMAKLPEKLNGKINVKIISQSGVKVVDYDKDFSFGYPMKIDLNGMAGGGYTIIFTNTTKGISYHGRFVMTGGAF
jgi:Zinc carboxypeptidase